MTQYALSTVSGSYYEMIQQNIKDNILKDALYVCTECGRLKNRDMELSGTMCNTCTTTNINLDAKINKFTTLVQNFQFDIGHPRNKVQEYKRKIKNEENVFVKPSNMATNVAKGNGSQYSLSKNFVQNSITLLKQNDKTSQTDFSFHPLDDVSFVIKSRQTCFNEISNAEVERHVETDKIASEVLNPINDSENIVSSKQQISSLNKTEFIKKNENSNNEMSNKCNTQNKDTDTEVIESSVDDWLMPKRMTNSPLLFSPETKDVDSDQEEYVDPTPTKEVATLSTCKWIKGNQDLSEEKSKNETLVNDGIERGHDMETNEIDEDITEQTEEEMEVDKDATNCNEDETAQHAANIYLKSTIDDNLETELKEDMLLTQATQKISKHNLKVVTSGLDSHEEITNFEIFVGLFNPEIDNDVNEDTDFLIVGVDDDNQVMKRTPKFLKAISLHICIVNPEYIHQCCIQKDLVSLMKTYIPFDSSGMPGPLRSYVRQDTKLFENFLFFSIVKQSYVASLIEDLIAQNGGEHLQDIKQFHNYELASDATAEKLLQYKRIFLYSDEQEEKLTPPYKEKLFTVFKCQCFNYSVLFNTIASYDAEPFLADAV